MQVIGKGSMALGRSKLFCPPQRRSRSPMQMPLVTSDALFLYNRPPGSSVHGRGSAALPRRNLSLFLFSIVVSRPEPRSRLTPHPRPRRTCAGCPSIDAVPRCQHPCSWWEWRKDRVPRRPYPPVVVVPDLVHHIVVATARLGILLSDGTAFGGLPCVGRNLQLEGERGSKDRAEHGVVPPEEGAAGRISFVCRRPRLFGRGLACRSRRPVSARSVVSPLRLVDVSPGRR